MTHSSEILFKLIRIAFGDTEDLTLPSDVDWKAVIGLAFAQGVAAIAADGLQIIYDHDPDLELAIDSPELENDKYEWFANQMSCEQDFAHRARVIEKISKLWRPEGIDFVILKGLSYASYYPIPEHRYSCDLDILPLNGWELSNSLLEQAGYAVDRKEKKHFHISVDGVHVENHQFVCGTKGNAEGKRFDQCLRGLLSEGKTELFHLLFYLKHAQTHFLIEDGIQLKHVLDWVYLRRFMSDETSVLVREFGLEKFAAAVDGAAAYVMGESAGLQEVSRVMLDDILALQPPLSSGGSRFRAHFNILRTIWRRRRFYRGFSHTTAFRQMWMYVTGYLLER